MDETIKQYIDEQITRMLSVGAVKAVGEWELDVLAVPFVGTDADGQYFDANTDIMHEAFSTPLAIYQHGVKQGTTWTVLQTPRTGGARRKSK